MEDWENDNKACLAVIGNALHSRVIKIKEQQAEIDVWKQRALNAEGLLIKIRTVHVTKTKGWFEDIDYLFKQKGFEWKNGYYEKTKHKGE